jgi:hypothetical protein
VAAKIKDFERQNSTESKNTPKRDIVDTNPHAYCAPGTTRTNNTAFLLYGSGHNTQKGTKLMGAILRVFVCDAMLSLGLGAISRVLTRDGMLLVGNWDDGRSFEDFEALRYGFIGVGRNFEGFGALRHGFTRVGRNFEGFGALRYGFTRARRNFEDFSMLCALDRGMRVRSMRRTSSMTPAYYGMAVDCEACHDWASR